MRLPSRFCARRIVPPAAALLASLVPALAAPVLSIDRAGSARSYYVEFRARYAGDVEHSVIVHGRLGPAGRPAERRFVSFLPLVDGWKGMVVPVPGAVYASEEDVETPPNTIYRRSLTAAEYARVTTTVRRFKAREQLWHIVLFNCNELPIEVATALGLRHPPSLMPPHLWVDALRLLNEP